MRKFTPILLALVFAPGCKLMDAKVIESLKGDKATVHVVVKSVYGSIEFSRANPDTNSIVTLKPDGTMTVERK